MQRTFKRKLSTFAVAFDNAARESQSSFSGERNICDASLEEESGLTKSSLNFMNKTSKDVIVRKGLIGLRQI